MKYREIPKIVEAIQVTEEQIWNWILHKEKYPLFVHTNKIVYTPGDKHIEFYLGTVEINGKDVFFGKDDFIVIDDKGNIFPCNHDVFKRKYEAI